MINTATYMTSEVDAMVLWLHLDYDSHDYGSSAGQLTRVETRPPAMSVWSLIL